jgi:hypothetical protein
LSYGRRVIRWLWPVWRPLGVVLVTALPMLAAWVATEREWWLRVVGVFVELAGFVTVWFQLRQAVRQHGRPTLLKRLQSWLAAVPVPGRTVVGNLSALAEGVGLAVAANLRLTKGKGDGSVGVRLEALEFNLDQLRDEFDRNRLETTRATRELRAQVDEEGRARAGAVGDLGKRLEDLAVGNAGWQTVGLVWFVAGAVFSNLADVVVRVFPAR